MNPTLFGDTTLIDALGFILAILLIIGVGWVFWWATEDWFDEKGNFK